jgi:hypothetical protein
MHVIVTTRDCRGHGTAFGNTCLHLSLSLRHRPYMTTSLNEEITYEERKDIWVELQSFRQDTLALRTEAYRLRTAGSLDASANERLRTQQKELEFRGGAIIKRCVYSFC